MSENEEFITIYEGNIIEAELIKGLLENSGIKAFLRDEIMGTIAPGYLSPGFKGSVKVVIFKKNLKKAEIIIKDFLDKKH
jgi:hypothetical protein